ncbi:hypothetical protein [uncultured Roseovarius sp.]|uniref:hypothetical protein n=1 Tax=uncultured Roseovarius sp. TaxID=293344 RepID=UPI002638E8B0|nr:hypothetical protein [uncultured Roseovarius sp.]
MPIFFDNSGLDAPITTFDASADMSDFYFDQRDAAVEDVKKDDLEDVFLFIDPFFNPPIISTTGPEPQAVFDLLRLSR